MRDGQVRVLVVDDQNLVRHGLRAVLGQVEGIRLVGEAANGADAIAAVRRLRPDVVLMDVTMPVMNGIEATDRLCRGPGPEVRVIILSVCDHDENVFRALRAGASGYILKDAPNETLVEAIRTVAMGEALLSPAVTRMLVDEFARRPALGGAPASALPALTGRERDVLGLLVQGYSNQDIAEALVLGESTVKSHVQHLYHKIGVRDRVQLVIYAYENGVVSRGANPARPTAADPGLLLGADPAPSAAGRSRFRSWVDDARRRGL